MRRPPVFVVGCPRSGTTLLRNLLRSHPQLAIPTESHFIPAFFRAYGDPSDRRQARRLARRILALRWVRDWELGIAPEELGDCRSFAQVIDRLYARYAATTGRSRWGDKTPQYVLHISTLDHLFPDALIVHLIRDGRSVAVSWQRALFGPGNPLAAARRWVHMVSAGREAGRRLGPARYLEVGYEDLVARVESTMRGVIDFIGEAWTPQVLVPTPPRDRTRKPVVGARRAGHAFASRVVEPEPEDWRADLGARGLELFESAAGPLLDELGYGGAGPVRRIAPAEQMVWKLQDRLRWVVDRLVADQKGLWLATELRLCATRLRARLARGGADP